MAGEQTIVQAIFSFKGSNNDELCFKKGDIITVTQKDDEWWEGTFDGKTGWFPCNYVKECKDIPKPTVQQDNQNKSFVLKNLIDSEKNHVQELEGLVTNYLQPLEKSNLLSQDEFKQLTGNLNEVLETHQQLLNLVEQEYGKSGPDQRVGKLFLNLAPKIKGVLQLYCSLHPRAVLILDEFREELTKFMELRGAVGPGIIVLTTLLSKPFRRLEKYSGLLQELERHIEECHPDRGDTQRSVSIYKDIATTCLATRRQKELELQVLTGPVRGWDGPNLTTLGEIIYMGSVAVGMQHHDRYFVLFPNNLIILSVSHRLSAFIYEAKLFLAGLNVARLEDTETVKNAFEISAPMIDTKIVICQSKKEADHWVELLTNNPGLRNSTTTSHNNKILPSQAQYVPQPPPHHHSFASSLNYRGYSNRTSIMSFRSPLNYQPTNPCENYPATAPFAGLSKFIRKKIKERILTRRLLRNLLYAEDLNKRNLNLVKIRHHRTEVIIMTKNLHIRDSVINCVNNDDDDDDEEDSSDDDCYHNQNAVEKNTYSSTTSSDNNPFGYIRYFNPKTGCGKDKEESTTKYESFLDYGEPLKVAAGSLKVIDEPTPFIKPSIILTSTAKLKFNKQISEESEGSSCIMAPRKPGHACENLLALGESFELETQQQQEQKSYLSLMQRQSCPTKLVGNKFNKSSLTTVYIPPWSNSENNLTCKLTNFNNNINNNNLSDSSTTSTTATHSSSIEIPATTLPLLLPDKMVAELLYGEFSQKHNVDDDDDRNNLPEKCVHQVQESSSSLLNDEGDDDKKISLNLKNIPFRKHSINSDKPRRRRCSIQINPTDDDDDDLKKKSTKKVLLLKRCVSSKFLNMKPSSSSLSSPAQQCSDENQPRPGTSTSLQHQKKCICRCGFENCHSRRSSDSGMAGSCTLNSPDFVNNDEEEEEEANHLLIYQKEVSSSGTSPHHHYSLSEIEARNFESQCPCSSPFGSTPRTSSETACHTRDSLRSTTSITTTSDDMMLKTQQQSQIMHCRVSNNNNNNNNMPRKSKSANSLLDLPSPSCFANNIQNDQQEEEGEEEEEENEPLLFRSGLYAHWWLKAKLPSGMLRGIYEESRIRHRSKTNADVSTNTTGSKSNK